MKQIRVEIIPDFFIGTTDTINDIKLNRFHEIKKFINLDKDLSFVGKWKEYTDPYKQNSILYSEKNNLTNYLISLSDMIYQSIENDEPILVCCKDCNQLAPLVAVVFLIRYGKLSIQNALRSIISKLPESPFQHNIEHLTILKTLI